MEKSYSMIIFSQFEFVFFFTEHSKSLNILECTIRLLAPLVFIDYFPLTLLSLNQCLKMFSAKKTMIKFASQSSKKLLYKKKFRLSGI